MLTQNFIIIAMISCPQLNSQGTLSGTAHLEKCIQLFDTKIYSYLETSGGQSSYPDVHFVHFFNNSVNYTSVAA